MRMIRGQLLYGDVPLAKVVVQVVKYLPRKCYHCRYSGPDEVIQL